MVDVSCIVMHDPLDVIVLLPTKLIFKPNGAEFDAQSHSVLLNDEVVTDKVVIEPDSYGIKIDDKYVTSLNCKDLSVIDGVDGKMSYNPETKTLTMEDVTINITGSITTLSVTTSSLSNTE